MSYLFYLCPFYLSSNIPRNNILSVAQHRSKQIAILKPHANFPLFVHTFRCFLKRLCCFETNVYLIPRCVWFGRSVPKNRNKKLSRNEFFSSMLRFKSFAQWSTPVLFLASYQGYIFFQFEFWLILNVEYFAKKWLQRNLLSMKDKFVDWTFLKRTLQIIVRFVPCVCCASDSCFNTMRHTNGKIFTKRKFSTCITECRVCLYEPATTLPSRKWWFICLSFVAAVFLPKSHEFYVRHAYGISLLITWGALEKDFGRNDLWVFAWHKFYMNFKWRWSIGLSPAFSLFSCFKFSIDKNAGINFLSKLS